MASMAPPPLRLCSFPIDEVHVRDVWCGEVLPSHLGQVGHRSMLVTNEANWASNAVW